MINKKKKEERGVEFRVFEKPISSKLIKTADEFIDLDLELDKFLLKKWNLLF